MCLFILLLLLGPRVVIVLWWLTAPLTWSAAFGGALLLPLVGFLFLPWTTLMYVLVAPGGVVGIDLLLLALALFADIASHAGGGVYRRRRA